MKNWERLSNKPMKLTVAFGTSSLSAKRWAARGMGAATLFLTLCSRRDNTDWRSVSWEIRLFWPCPIEPN